MENAGHARRSAQAGLLLAALFATASAAEPMLLAGTPPVVRHAPGVDVYPQNFCIVQDADGIVYVGNSNGVLEFDGERWSLWPLPNGDIVRSLALGSDGRIFVGGYNALGWLARDATGALRFTDLSAPALAALGGRELADVWDTVVAPEGVWFRALHDVFLLDPGSGRLQHWHHPGRFGALVHHAGRTLLQFRGEGLRAYRDGVWLPMPGTASLQSLVHTLVPLADGDLLGIGSADGWVRVSGDSAAPAHMPEGTPPALRVDRAAALPDGSIALADNGGVLYIVDAALKKVRSVRVEQGFLSGVAPAAGGGLLVSGDQAIFHVQWPARWSVLGAEHGAGGSLHAVAAWDGRWHVATSSGIFLLESDASGEPRLLRVDWWQGMAYDLHALDPRRVLVAGSHHLQLVVDGQARTVGGEEPLYPRLFLASRFVPGRILLGTENGLRHLQLAAGEPRLLPRGHVADGIRVSSIVEVAADRTWIGTDRHGLWRADGDPAAALSVRAFAEPAGLRFGPIRTASVSRDRDGSVLVSTHAGLFRWNGERFVEAGLDGLGGLRGEGELLQLRATSEGVRWAWSTGRILRQAPGQDWAEQQVRALRRGAIGAIEPLEGGRAVFVAGQALLVHDGDAEAPGDAGAAPAPGVSLRSVQRVLADGTRQPLPLSPQQAQVLPGSGEGISFQFALPELTLAGGAEYQGRLLGYEQAWSPWSRSRGYTYSRLSPGDYVLQVRGRDAAGRISEIRPWHLRVEPAWYARWWAMALWCGLALLLAWGLWVWGVRRRTARLADQARRLEAVVAERTAELECANQRLDAMAHLDGLTGIANRRSLDQRLAEAWDQACAARRTIAVLTIDVDHFKRFNDTRGHLAGDQLLRDLAHHLLGGLRGERDLLARYGGEEFVAILPGADAANARAVAERMCRRVREARLGTTVSIGVASRVPRPGDALADLLHQADQALYAAKRAGRDQVAQLAVPAA